MAAVRLLAAVCLLFLALLGDPLVTAVAPSALRHLDCFCRSFLQTQYRPFEEHPIASYCTGDYYIITKSNPTSRKPNSTSQDDFGEEFDEVSSWYSCGGAAWDEAFQSSLAAAARLVSRYNSSGVLPEEGADECRAVEGIQHVGRDDYIELQCRVAQEVLDSRPDKWLEDMEWSENVLHKFDEQKDLVDRLLLIIPRLLKAVKSNKECSFWRNLRGPNATVTFSEVRKNISDFWQKHAQLVSFAARYIERTLTAMLLEQKVSNMSEQQETSFMKHIEKLGTMLHMHTSGWIADIYDIIDEMENIHLYILGEKLSDFVIRYPLLNERLLDLHESFLTLRAQSADLCEPSVPGATAMLQMADTLYSSLDRNWFRRVPDWFRKFSRFRKIYEEWDVEDLSERRVSVDSGCVQLLVHLLDQPGCPLVDIPEETVRQVERCRLQLGTDVMLGLSYIPVTSYLAYTQRVNINLCLLSWMVASPHTICQDVPHRIVKSVSEAHCLFSQSQHASCKPNATADTVCYVSRAVFKMKCNNFYNYSAGLSCLYSHKGGSMVLEPYQDIYPDFKDSDTIVTSREILYNATIKYRNFKIDHLHTLEVSLISVNVLFRCLTAGVFLSLPKLRNLPGKLLLCFQIAGLLQISCSEVAYRMYGVPDLATAIQLDSSLTLLGCVWLNAFCHHLLSGIRHLRLPDNLDPREAGRLFRTYVTSALAVWAVLSSVFVCLERLGEQYLLHSRSLLLTAIALSVAGNFLLLLIIGLIYIRTRKSLSVLRVINDDKLGSRKQQCFLMAKTVLLSGLGVLVRAGFQQADGIARAVYCVHLASMLQGPAIFVLFVCDGRALPQLRRRLQRWWKPAVSTPADDLCSTARENLDRRRWKAQRGVVETAV